MKSIVETFADIVGRIQASKAKGHNNRQAFSLMTEGYTHMTLQESIVPIATKEIGVAEIGSTNKGKRVNEYKAATWLDPTQAWPWCFDSSVEILTSGGWNLIRELTEGEDVAQVNPCNGQVSFVKPIAKIHTRKRMPIATITTRSMSLRCDARHRFWGHWNTTRQLAEPELRPISDLTSSLAIPAVISGSSDNPNFCADRLDFIAAFIADGFIHKKGGHKKQRIEIQISKERKLAAMQRHGCREYVASKCYGASTTPLTTFEHEIPEYFSQVFSDYKEIRWDWALSLSAEQAGLFVDRYLFWDGTVSRRVISTTRKQNADIFVTLALLAGRHPNMRARLQCGKKTCYEITVAPKLTRTIKPEHLEIAEDEIDLYCVQVPSGLIICRDSNGTPFVTGNCAAFVDWVVMEAMDKSGVGETLTFQRPRTAGAWDLENWSLKQDNSTWTKNPHRGDIQVGDIIIFTFSHCGFAASGPDKNGQVITIEGNSNQAGSRDGGSVIRRKRDISQIRSRIRFRV